MVYKVGKQLDLFIGGEKLQTVTDEPQEISYKPVKDYGDFIEADDGMLYWHWGDSSISGGQVKKDTPIGLITLEHETLNIFLSPNPRNLGYIYIDGELNILSRK
ncbi:hypothetical protein RND61_14720 [Streptomyces sp. TRM76323]|uniref:Uncharacterized protein n=1 Tax=Streptomyces tamarix TaxID=3078565 RepID=A0ABU3QKN5_9ACTN|nr:hypothetical protein [Streptomyces tamarix]MDT9683316.1 hypothetical protein [Streptomyces tamarix]